MEKKKRVIDNLKNGGCKYTINHIWSEINDLESTRSIRRILHPRNLKVQILHFIIPVLIIFISPKITIAQLPNLGSAINFVVFTSVGALGNTGTSNITGDIGTDSGAITGFGAPTVLNGTIEWENAVTAQCAIDVQTAYNEIFGITPTVVGHAPAYGSGETLPAGVYSIAAAGSIDGNLTLDAAGDPDAIFIFQFGGAFTTGASSTVNLINEASACNVFWIAEGAMSMAAFTDMKGTLISNNGAISMDAGGTLDGRMLSTAGEASVYDVMITKPDCLALPIGLLSFTGSCDQQNIVLQWITETENNNNYFTIERSPDLKTWHAIGTVEGAGNSSFPLNYTLTDLVTNVEITYYRLKQTDFDGNYNYEAMIGVNSCEANMVDQLTIYPNPSEGKFKLLFNGNPSDINSIQIFNSQGQIIYNTFNFESTFDLTNNVPGIYFIRVQKNSEVIRLKYILLN